MKPLNNPTFLGNSLAIVALSFLFVIAVVAFPPLLIVFAWAVWLLCRDARQVAAENRRREAAHAAKRRQWGLD